MYDVRKVANWFIHQAKLDGKYLSISKISKLCYIAQGWHLGLKQTPLFNNHTEAWLEGPLIRDVTRTFHSKGYNGSNPDMSYKVTETVGGFDSAMPQDKFEFMATIYNIHGHLNDFNLAEMIKEPGGAWDIAYRYGGNGTIIQNEDIQHQYQAKMPETNIHAEKTEENTDQYYNEIMDLREGMKDDWQLLKHANQKAFQNKQNRLKEIKKILDNNGIICQGLELAINTDFTRTDRDAPNLSHDLIFTRIHELMPPLEDDGPNPE